MSGLRGTWLAAGVVAALAIGGTALAGDGAGRPALERAISKQKVKSVAAKQVKKLAPELEVKSAKTTETASTAASAENAARADDARKVGGLEVKKVHFRTGFNQSQPRTILDFTNNFRIDASCTGSGDVLDLAAFTAHDDSVITIVSSFVPGANDADGARHIRSEIDGDLDRNEGFAIDNNLVATPGAGFPGHPFGTRDVTIHFTAPTGFVATVKLQTSLILTNVGPLTGCFVSGSAVGG